MLSDIASKMAAQQATGIRATIDPTSGSEGDMSNPVIQNVAPNSGDQGDRFTVTITGDVFTHVIQASFGSGISIENLTVVNDGEIRVKIRIQQDAVHGARSVTLQTATGVGTLAGFTVN